MNRHIQRFARELTKPDPLPEQLALAIAGLAHPDLEVAHSLEQMDEIAVYARERVYRAPGGYRRAEAFLRVMHGELGFSGNKDEYYDPANSFLNDVLERRTGLPILLSLLYIAIGRRIGLSIEGIGFPGHFMARYRDADGTWLLDPFHGEVMQTYTAETYLSRLFQQHVVLTPSAYEPVSAPDLAQRILNNLRTVYLSSNDYARAVHVLDYLVVLMPNNPMIWQERALLNRRDQMWGEAARDLRRYFFLNGHLPIMQDSELEEQFDEVVLSREDEYLLEMLYEVEQLRVQLN